MKQNSDVIYRIDYMGESMELIEPNETFEIDAETEWLLQATRLKGGMAIKMAVIILKISQQMGRRKFIPIFQQELKQHDVSAISGYRALNALDAAGLIRVTRRIKQPPLIEIMGAETDVTN